MTQAQTTPDTSPGTLNNSLKKRTQATATATELHEKIDPNKVDDTRDTVHSFLDKVALAQADETMSDEDRWVEVDEVIVKHYNRGKVPASGYFTYGSPGVKVAVKGRLEEILKREQITQEDKLFPNGFGNTETYAD